jgi:uncharacterized surface protein with fasciclin (FAS1) repeats
MTSTDRRTVLKTLATGTLLATTAGTAAARPGKGKRQGASAPNTITEIAAADPATFSTLVSLLQDTGLDDVLDERGRQYTVFAPTNTAFANTDLGNPTLDEVENVLLYHVTNGRRYANSVVRAPRIKMLNGGTVDVDGTDLNGDQADIVGTNIEASNGVIHVINGVLLP